MYIEHNSNRLYIFKYIPQLVFKFMNITILLKWSFRIQLCRLAHKK